MSERIEATVTRDGFHVTVSAAVDYDCGFDDALGDVVIQSWDRYGWACRSPGGSGGSFHQPPRPDRCDGDWICAQAHGSSQGEEYRVWIRRSDIGDAAEWRKYVRDIACGLVSAYNLRAEVRAVPGGTVIGAASCGGCWLDYREADPAGILACADGYDLVSEAIAEARHAAARIAAALTAEAAAVAALVGGAA